MDAIIACRSNAREQIPTPATQDTVLLVTHYTSIRTRRQSFVGFSFTLCQSLVTGSRPDASFGEESGR